MNNLQRYNKAYVPVGVALLLVILNQFGISKEMSVQDLLTFLATSLAVYFVPNKD